MRRTALATILCCLLLGCESTNHTQKPQNFLEISSRVTQLKEGMLRKEVEEVIKPSALLGGVLISGRGHCFYLLTPDIGLLLEFLPTQESKAAPEDVLLSKPHGLDVRSQRHWFCREGKFVACPLGETQL